MSRKKDRKNTRDKHVCFAIESANVDLRTRYYRCDAGGLPPSFAVPASSADVRQPVVDLLELALRRHPRPQPQAPLGDRSVRRPLSLRHLLVSRRALQQLQDLDLEAARLLLRRRRPVVVVAEAVLAVAAEAVFADRAAVRLRCRRSRCVVRVAISVDEGAHLGGVCLVFFG